MDEKELQALYNAMSPRFDVGDWATFRNKMSTPEQRKSFFDAVGQQGFDLGDYNQYETRLAGVKKKESFDTNPHSYLNLFGKKLGPSGNISSPSELQLQSQEETNNLPSTSNLTYQATDARLGSGSEGTKEKIASPKSLGKAALMGLASVGSGTLKSIGIAAKKLDFFNEYKDKKPEELATYKAGKWLDEQVKDLVGDLPEEDQNKFSVHLAHNIGGLFGYYLGGGGSRLLGGSEGLTAATLGGLTQGSVEYDNAVASGATPDQASKAFWLNTAIGTTQAIPVMGAFRKLDKYSGGLATGALAKELASTAGGRLTGDIVQGAITNAAQMAGMTIATNVVAKNTYDETRNVFDGLKESLATGTIVGGFLHGVTSKIRERRANPNITPQEDADLKKAEDYATKKLQETDKEVKIANHAEKVRENVSHLPEEHQDEFVKQSVREKVANDNAEKLTDPTLIKQNKEAAKEAHEIKEQLLQGKDPDEIVTEAQQKKIDDAEKVRVDLERLTEDNKRGNEKIDADIEDAKKELSGLDGRKTEDKAKVKSLREKAEDLEIKKKRLNEDHEKKVAKLQEKAQAEEKVAPQDVSGKSGEEIDLSKAKLNYHVSKSPQGVVGEVKFGNGLHGKGFYTASEKSKVPFSGDSEQFLILTKKPFEETWKSNYRDKGINDDMRTETLLAQGYDTIKTGDYEVAIGSPKQVIKIEKGTTYNNILQKATEYFGNEKEAIDYLKSKGIEQQAPKEQLPEATEQGIALQKEEKSRVEPDEFGILQKLKRREINTIDGTIDGVKIEEVYSALDLGNKPTIERNELYEKIKSLIQKTKIRKANGDIGGEVELVNWNRLNQLLENQGEKPERSVATEDAQGTTADKTKKETEVGKPPTEPPKAEPPPTEEKGGGKDKGILNRLYEAKNVPEASKKGFEEKGLKYEPQSHEEAEQLGKAIVGEFGIDDAVTLAEGGRIKGGVRSAIFAASLDKLSEQESSAKTPQEKIEVAKKFAEIGIRYDEFSREQGRDISQIGYFYKKSPLGVQMIENAKRKQDFENWAKPKDKSWQEFFDEMMKEPEFKDVVTEKVKEELKKERAEARKERIKKVDDFFDKAKKDIEGEGGALYSTIIPPKIMKVALDAMQKAYHGGEKVAELIQNAIDYISEQIGQAPWDKDKFRKEWEDKLKDKVDKKPLTDEEVKAKLLDKFRNKLKGLSDRQKEDVVRKSFAKIVESGGLDYADFRKIIAEVTGRGEMTEAEAAKLKELVKQTNAVDEAGKKAREVRTQEARKEFRQAEIKAGNAARELNKLLYNRPNITKRLTSLMQLNTLGIPALVNNPIYNVINHLGIRLPVGVVRTGIERLIQGGAKLIGKEYKPEVDILSLQVQKEFFRKLGLGTRESVGQFLTGLNRMDYLNKEIQGQQIRPLSAMKDLWAYHKGEIHLTKTQVIDKIIQASPPGITAEIIARTLNLGDKPQRFAAEGAQAAAFAKSLGLKDIDYDLFIDFPREEAYRAYKTKGLSDAEAGQKADYVKDTIVKEGERSTFQQDNMLSDALNKVFGGKESGVGGLIKAVAVSPYIKIPSNAYWSYYNIVNPEVAMLQSMIYAGKAYAKSKGAKFLFDKPNSTAAKDLHEAKYWLAHAAVGMATRAVIMAMVSAGIYRSGNTGDDTKKEREGEQFYENQGTMNISKLWAWMRRKDPNEVKNGLIIQDRWAGHFGTVGNTIARKEEEKTPEQKQDSSDFWDAAIGGMELYALQDFEQGVFGNTQSLLSSMQQGIKTGNIGSGLNAWGVNTLNMFANIVHPAASAQIEKAFLPYYTKQKADTFMQEVKNSMLTRSAILRKVLNQYPPSKVGIWGDRLDKKDNVAMRLFGISRANDDNFAQPLYEDYKKTNDIGFFPPAVMPEVNNQKLNTAQAAELEELVGHARKELIAPYINDMAILEGHNKLYSELSTEEKKKSLSTIYELGRDEGVERFIGKHPEFKKKEETVEDIIKGAKEGIFRTVIKAKQLQKTNQ